MKKILLIILSAFALAASANTVGHTTLPFQEFTFDKDVRPILNNRCAVCHVGNKGMLNLLDYQVAKTNSSKIKSAVVSNVMPLRNITGITDVERRIIGLWVDQGAKK
jgi:uncharacterized membrane protein